MTVGAVLRVVCPSGVLAALPAQQEKIFPLAQINDELGSEKAIGEMA